MRNVDIIAVGILLAGIALYTHARHMVVYAIDSNGIGFTRYSRAVIVPPVPAVPPLPPLPPIPHIRAMRD
ncbi:MAG: hypothetical protein JO097_01440 [Acidobacteriaceae bacterium]|nr:hypothetical protein [Acidobacteriaceae bacterium]